MRSLRVLPFFLVLVSSLFLSGCGLEKRVDKLFKRGAPPEQTVERMGAALAVADSAKFCNTFGSAFKGTFRYHGRKCSVKGVRKSVIAELMAKRLFHVKVIEEAPKTDLSVHVRGDWGTGAVADTAWDFTLTRVTKKDPWKITALKQMQGVQFGIG
jgi:hypothetical protein